MYFPDNFAGLRGPSELVHRFVSRWRTAIGRQLRKPQEDSLRPRRNGGVSALWESGECIDQIPVRKRRPLSSRPPQR